MNLPTDSAEQKKLIVAVVLGLGVLIFVLHAFVIKPLAAKSTRMKAEIQSNTEEIEEIRAYLSAITRRRQPQIQIIEAILPEVRNPDFAIRPRFGNYELPVEERLGQYTAAAGITPDTVRAGGNAKALVSRAFSGFPPLLLAYPSTIHFSADFKKTLRFLQILQSENKYCSISRFSVSATPETPMSHSITLQIDWPVWSEQDGEARLRNAMTNAMNSLQENPAR